MDPLSFTEVGDILRLIGGLDCDTFELAYGDLKISVRRDGGTGPPDAVQPAAAPAAGAVEPMPSHNGMPPDNDRPAGQDGSAGQDGLTGAENAAAGPGIMVAAPMTGTFYRSPAPGDPPFVQAGDHVEAGQTVGLIEVMKLFTELKAEAGGTVARIEAEDRSLVEFDQPLMWIEAH